MYFLCIKHIKLNIFYVRVYSYIDITMPVLLRNINQTVISVLVNYVFQQIDHWRSPQPHFTDSVKTFFKTFFPTT